jgi:rhodanese-related sulfurtransferase
MGMLKEGLGYTNVRILENGLTQWMLAGYPVVGGGA